MPQSLDKVLLHVIFSTKDRFAFLDDAARGALHPYVATVVRNLGCGCVRVGGTADHVHLAIQMSRTIAIADLVQGTKAKTSRWLKDQSPRLEKLAWQRGYGVFSLSPSDLDACVHYIDNQEEHHRKRTFKDEFRAFLTKYGVPFDERYVWD